MAGASGFTLEYADGSANHYRVVCSAGSADAEVTYTPVTPRQSSSGVYSGGAPWRARLPARDARVGALLEQVTALERDTTLHAETRSKGTGAVTLTTAAGTRSFLVAPSAALRALDAALAALR
ncbi:MAG: hypothetical protein IT370_18785 [Deltaproteobacteria bacterium]|nr:hypothetical protein [Deltaproteobacteria bacterium]